MYHGTSRRFHAWYSLKLHYEETGSRCSISRVREECPSHLFTVKGHGLDDVIYTLRSYHNISKHFSHTCLYVTLNVFNERLTHPLDHTHIGGVLISHIRKNTASSEYFTSHM
jgi:hypothetical protein